MKRIEASQTLPAREQASGHNSHPRLPKRLRPDPEALWKEVVQLGGTSEVLITERGVEAQEDNCDIEADTGHLSTGVEIVLQMSDKTSPCLLRQALVFQYLDNRRGVPIMKGLPLKRNRPAFTERFDTDYFLLTTAYWYFRRRKWALTPRRVRIAKSGIPI